MNKKDRILKIGIAYIIKANRSTRQLEAFAFSVIVKTYFVNSKYYDKVYKYAEIAKILQISVDKAKRILNDVVEYNYATWNENHTSLSFRKIKYAGRNCYKFCVNDFINKNINNNYVKKNDTNYDCISLKMIVDELRKILIKVHIQQENYINDTKTGFANEQNLSKAKRMSKIIVKYGINMNKNVDRGISLESFMRVTNVKSRNNIVKLINGLIESDSIEKKKNILLVGITNKNITYKSNEFGAFFTYNNKLYKVSRNTYLLKDFERDKIGC